jgi:hypothetical protein
MKLSIFVPLATFLAFFAVAEKTDETPSVCLVSLPISLKRIKAGY